jgi:hypothetical protein
MYIQGYQIHNVLNVFRRQLSQGAFDSSRHGGPHRSAAAPAMISKKKNKQSIMEKVAANVFRKITNVAPGSDIVSPMGDSVNNVDKGSHAASKDNAFVYHTIVDNNRKETRSIAVNDSQGLMSQLDELAKAAVNRSSDEAVGITDRELATRKGWDRQER